jgi:hypothetical protein
MPYEIKQLLATIVRLVFVGSFWFTFLAPYCLFLMASLNAKAFGQAKR